MDHLFLNLFLMNETKTISKKKRVKKSDKAILNTMVEKNPNLRTLIEKLDLQITKTSKS